MRVGERDDGTHPFHERAGLLSYLKWKKETEIEMYEGILQTCLNGSTLEPACMVHPRIKDLFVFKVNFVLVPFPIIIS